MATDVKSAAKMDGVTVAALSATRLSTASSGVSRQVAAMSDRQRPHIFRIENLYRLMYSITVVLSIQK